MAKKVRKKKINFFRNNIFNIINEYNSAFFLNSAEYKKYENTFKVDIIIEDLEHLLNDIKNLENISDNFLLINLPEELIKYKEAVSKGEWVYVEYDYYGEKFGSIEKKDIK